jgi:hypothetical protein
MRAFGGGELALETSQQLSKSGLAECGSGHVVV